MASIGRSLRSMWLIFKHEFGMYFVSPIMYLIGAVWLFLAGGFFYLSLGNMNQGATPNMIGMHQPMVFLMIFVAPALTMRLVADEYRAGTHELLFTSPLRDWEIIVGKWLAVWGVFTVFILMTAFLPVILVLAGNPDIGLILTGYLGLWLFGGATLAIGVFASSITQYQPVAFMVGMGLLVFLWLTQVLTQVITSTVISNIATGLSLLSHYGNLVSRAVIDPLDLTYFLGMMAVFLFLAVQMLSARRWSA